MAKKGKTVFVCQECGYESEQWLGKCICGAWSSFVEEKVLPPLEEDLRRRTTKDSTSEKVKVQKLKEVGSADRERIDTGIGELNRVLGGGLVKGSLTLISGEPGIGKSTLIMQAAHRISKAQKTVLYVSGEESEEQLKLRADRICRDIPEGFLVLSETNMENVEVIVENVKPDFLIIDSIQTMYSDQLDSAPGSVSQVRQVGNQLMKIGKTAGIPVFIVAHVTKSGELAGPKIVEHLVDCVLNFTGERDHDLRMLRSYKNRFGTTAEIGAFRMESEGLCEVRDISAMFLENRDEMTEGSVTTAIYEGSRPVVFEIQALTASCGTGFGRRTAVGVDFQRLNMIIAVLEKKAGLKLLDKDVYTNVVGGMKPDTTGIDLAVALAICSSYQRIKPSKRILAIGEVGLTGDLRSVQYADRIVKEAARLGYEKVILPLKNASGLSVEGCEIKGVKNIYEAIEAYGR